MKSPNHKSQITNKFPISNHKRNLKLEFWIYFGFWILIFGFNPAFAQTLFDPLTVGIGARALGMGKAVTAVSDGSDMVFNNPAALGEVDQFRFTSMSGRLMEDVEYISLGGIFPLGQQSALGFGFTNAAVTEIEIRNYRGTLLQKANFGNGLFLAGWGKKISEQISFGVNLKYYFVDATEIDSGDGGGWNLDLALLKKGDGWFNLGIVAQNLIDSSPLIFQNGEKEKLPTKIKLGSLFHIAGQHFNSAYYAPFELQTALDLEWGIQHSDPLLFHGGVEFSPLFPLSLRLGFDQTATPIGIQSHACAGIGLRVAGIGFDYAYYPQGDPSDSVSHFFSLTFDERGWPPEPSNDILLGKQGSSLIL